MSVSKQRKRHRYTRSILKHPPKRQQQEQPPAKIGRPTAYEGEITCEKARRYFFQTVEPIEGRGVSKEIARACYPPFPTLVDFARTIGVTYTTIKSWVKTHAVFAATIKECQEYQKHLLIANALAGRYDRTFSIFMLKNLWKWMDVARDENWRDDLHHDHAVEGQTMTEFIQGMWERAEQISPRPRDFRSLGAMNG